MKQLCLFVALIFLFSCTKQNFNEPISGTWTIIESNVGTSSGYTVQTFSPSTELTLEFASNGQLLLNGANPGLATSPLWDYNRYELQADNKIRFYQSAGNKEMQAFVSINGNLYLNYLWARSGYEEKFLKIK